MSESLQRQHFSQLTGANQHKLRYGGTDKTGISAIHKNYSVKYRDSLQEDPPIKHINEPSQHSRSVDWLQFSTDFAAIMQAQDEVEPLLVIVNPYIAAT